MSPEAMIPARLVQAQRDKTAAALASEHYSTEEREVYEGEVYRLDLLLAQAVRDESVADLLAAIKALALAAEEMSDTVHGEFCMPDAHTPAEHRPDALTHALTLLEQFQ